MKHWCEESQSLKDVLVSDETLRNITVRTESTSHLSVATSLLLLCCRGSSWPPAGWSQCFSWSFNVRPVGCWSLHTDNKVFVFFYCAQPNVLKQKKKKLSARLTNEKVQLMLFWQSVCIISVTVNKGLCRSEPQISSLLQAATAAFSSFLRKPPFNCREDPRPSVFKLLCWVEVQDTEAVVWRNPTQRPQRNMEVNTHLPRYSQLITAAHFIYNIFPLSEGTSSNVINCLEAKDSV